MAWQGNSMEMSWARHGEYELAFIGLNDSTFSIPSTGQYFLVEGKISAQFTL
jgi:hypothetical protein